MVTASLLLGVVGATPRWWWIAGPWLALMAYFVFATLRANSLGGLIYQNLQTIGSEIVSIQIDEAGLLVLCDGLQSLYKWSGVIDFVELADVWAIRIKPDLAVIIIPKRAFESQTMMELLARALKNKARIVHQME